eukprot:11941556-Alexandrium_andersonii.AAC.1
MYVVERLRMSFWPLRGHLTFQDLPSNPPGQGSIHTRKHLRAPMTIAPHARAHSYACASLHAQAHMDSCELARSPTRH